MPKVTRRDFIKLGSAAAAGVAVGSRKGADAMELEIGESSYNYARVAAKREAAYSVSPFGKQKLPLQVFTEKGERVVSVIGHPSHPSTRGRTTAVDAVSHMINEDPDRITSPLKRTGERGAGSWRRISWDDAVGEISAAIAASLENSGPSSVCLVRGEDRENGIWKRFMHSLGSESIFELSGDRNKKTAQKLTWGMDFEVPDFENSRYILNFGSNVFETFPAYTQAIVDARAEKHARLITFDPRLSMTAGLSDEWIPVKPGTDGIVALAMANVIMSEGLADRDFIETWTNVTHDGLAKYLSSYTPDMAEEESGVPADKIVEIAREFASIKPATIFTYRGLSSHTNGLETERACMLLPVITGNVDVKGGYGLPSRLSWGDILPLPSVPDKKINVAPALFPQLLRSGEIKAGVLFFYGTNPAHSAAGSEFWKETVKEKSLAPLTVAIGTHMTATASLCDIVLPDTTFLERAEPVMNKMTAYPSMSARIPVVEAPDEVQDLALTLRDIAQAVDETVSNGAAKYWEFDDPEELLEQHFAKVPGLEEEGGAEAVTDSGFWPVYGELDTESGKILDDDEKPVQAKYGKALKEGLKTASGRIEIYSKQLNSLGASGLPTWVTPENLASEEGDLILITFKTAYQNGSATLNNKFLAEKSHANHCMINKETAAEKGIADGDLIRVSSETGYIVTRARVTNAIHPEAVGIAAAFGQTTIGRVAGARPQSREQWTNLEDKDVHYNLWWRDTGVNPNGIMPLYLDPYGKGSATSFKVNVSPASKNDRYGDIHVDKDAQALSFEKAAKGRGLS